MSAHKKWILFHCASPWPLLFPSLYFLESFDAVHFPKEFNHVDTGSAQACDFSHLWHIYNINDGFSPSPMTSNYSACEWLNQRYSNWWTTEGASHNLSGTEKQASTIISPGDKQQTNVELFSSWLMDTQLQQETLSIKALDLIWSGLKQRIPMLI